MLKHIKLSNLIYPIILLILLLLLSCEHKSHTSGSVANYKEEVAYDQGKDLEIQKYNLELKKKSR